MPFQPGNQEAKKGQRAKQFADAIRAAVNEEHPVLRRRKLVIIAEKVADMACAGEAWAVQQVADRLDGRPAQESTLTVRSELDSMSEHELRDFIRRELAAGGAGGAAAAEQPGSQVTH
jgi:hypothetical protein